MPIRPLTLLSILSVFLLPTFTASVHAAPETYAIGSVSVSGGLPVAERDDGVVYAQSFDAGCSLLPMPGDTPDPLLAVALGDSLTLDVTLLGCRRSAPPAVRCDWTIEPRATSDDSCRAADTAPLTGAAEWQGWQHAFTPTLPTQTGAYRLTLACHIDSADSDELVQLIELPLVVNYDAPLAAFSPPKAQWYEHAACWAGGFTAQSSEHEILQTLQDSIYRYGGRHWRYGYAQKIADDHYQFALLANAGGTRSIDYILTQPAAPVTCWGEAPFACTCAWQALLEAEPVCNFTDCYTLTNTFAGMAAVSGIGGLRNIGISGGADRGFLTHPGQVFDPRFTGNVHCGGDDACRQRYFFGAHNLVERDGVYYDVTFNKRYEAVDGLISGYRMAGATDAGAGPLSDTAAVIAARGTGYGSWRIWDYRPRVPSSAALPVADTAAPLRLADSAQFTPRSWDEDARFEDLNAAIDVEVLVPADTGYILDAALYRDGEPIARLPFWGALETSRDVLAGVPGQYRAKFNFSGEQIYQSARNGPYQLRITLAGQPDAVLAVIDTPAFDYREFGEHSGRIAGIRLTARKENNNENRIVRVILDIRDAGSLALSARLFDKDSGTTHAYGGRQQEFFPGRHVLDLGFAPAATTGITPDSLILVLYDAELRPIDDREVSIKW